MSLCQIVSIGREHQWLKIGLKEHPKTKLFVILSNEKDKNDYNYYNEAVKIKKEIEGEQKDFPEEFRTKIEIVNFEPYKEDYYALFNLILEMIKKISLNYSEIIINATSGLQLLKLVLFQVTLMNKNIVKEYFIYNKQDNKKQSFWLQETLSKGEWEVLKIISMKNQPSITEIEKEFTKGQLSYVLKIVKSLSKNNLVVEKKEGRQKIVELSAMGKALTGSYLKEEKISDVLKDFLEKKSEMENNTKNKELLDSLQESAKFFSNLCEKIVNFEGPRIENDKLKSFAGFLAYLIDAAGKKGYLTFLLALCMILNENLAGRISTHRFTQFQFDVSSDDEFEYFKRIDNEKEKLIKNISDLREHTKNLQELLDEDPPGMGQTRSVTVNDYQLEKYFLEYLDAIAQQYESFDFLSLYCLILIKLLKEHPIQDDLKKFKESHKEKVKNLYFGKNGLEKYLTELNFKEPFNSQIKDFYKSIFGDESIRELRNLKIHHYVEERIRYEKGKLHVTYPNGTSIIYSLEEIKAFKINLQLTVFLGYYMVMHSFHEMFYQRLLKEFGITSVN